MQVRLTKTAAREVARSMNPLTSKTFSSVKEYREYLSRRRQRIAWQTLYFLGTSATRAQAVVAGISSQANLSLNTLIDCAIDCLSDY